MLEAEGPLKDMDVDSVARRARTLRNHMAHLQNRANNRSSRARTLTNVQMAKNMDRVSERKYYCLINVGDMQSLCMRIAELQPPSAGDKIAGRNTLLRCEAE